MIQKTEAEIMRNWQGDPNYPMVSIRCTVYNHRKYIEKCLDGFLMQETTFPYEVIVHDDVSTDGTVEIIQEYEKRFPNIIRPIYETENQYSKQDGSLFRVLKDAIKGKYIAVCEGDDFWTDSRKLQVQYEALENNPDCSISFNRVQFVEENGTPLNQYAPAMNTGFGGKITLKDYCDEEYREGRWAFHTSSFFYRQSLDEDLYNFRTNDFSVCPYGDMSMQLFLLLKGNGFFVNDTMGCYRKNAENSYHQKLHKDQKYAYEQIKRLIEALKQFDRMTDYQYHEEIDYRIRREEFNILQYQRNAKAMLSPYFGKVIHLNKRIKKAIEAIFPDVYLKARNKYHQFRGD